MITIKPIDWTSNLQLNVLLGRVGVGGIWNLWHMLNLSVKSWIEIGQSFNDLTNPLSAVSRSGLQENREHIIAPLRRIAECCAEIQLPFSESYAIELVEYYSKMPTFSEYFTQELAGINDLLSGKAPTPLSHKNLKEEIAEIYHPPRTQSVILSDQIQTLQKRIEDELAGRTFYGVDPSEVRMYLRSDWIGAAVLDKFGGLQWEAMEAGTCFSLGRDTACVFHLMRILEYGLASLADALNVVITNPNWHQILLSCEKQISARNGNDPNWKRDEPFFHSLALEFRHFQWALRNHTAHAKARYSHEECRIVMEHVSSFMRQVSTRLSQVPMP